MSPAEPYSRLAGVYDEIVVDPCYGRWSGFLHELWSGDEDGVHSVLDVCCGTGLMAVELIALGYRVTGVDCSVAMLARARRRLGPDVALVRETLPDLTIDGRFDAAVSTFDGFNYLTPAEMRATLVALAGRVRPGGWLVFDAHTDAMMDFATAHPAADGEADGHRLTVTSVVDVQARTCDSRVQVTRVDDGGAFSEHHRQYFFSDAQIRGALAAAGFEQIAVTDEYTHSPVDVSTLRATWTARRGGSR